MCWCEESSWLHKFSVLCGWFHTGKSPLPGRWFIFMATSYSSGNWIHRLIICIFCTINSNVFNQINVSLPEAEFVNGSRTIRIEGKFSQKTSYAWNEKPTIFIKGDFNYIFLKLTFNVENDTLEFESNLMVSSNGNYCYYISVLKYLNIMNIYLKNITWTTKMLFNLGMEFAITLSYSNQEFKVQSSDYDEDYGKFEVSQMSQLFPLSQ